VKRLAIAALGLALVVGVLAAFGPSVRAQPTASIALPPPRGTVQLYAGCNNVALSFPDGTDSQTVVDAVTPAGVVEAMWRHNAAQNRFEGFSPAAPQASDLLTVNLWDAVWLCVAGTPPPVPTVSPVPAPGPTVDDDPARGPQDAPVTMIEFSDFQCPYCARFFRDTLPLILGNYGDRVRFVYRDFPLTSIHSLAQKAAEAAECADDQGAFWKYHDLLFENQSALDEESLKGYAASLGLDTVAFNDCLTSGKYTAEVRKDVQDGLAAGVQGVPTFFINGVPIAGAQAYPVFEDAIEAALAEAGG